MPAENPFAAPEVKDSPKLTRLSFLQWADVCSGFISSLGFTGLLAGIAVMAFAAFVSTVFDTFSIQLAGAVAVITGLAVGFFIACRRTSRAITNYRKANDANRRRGYRPTMD